MQKHSDSYDAYKALRRVDARVTIMPKAAEILGKVSIKSPELACWETFLPDELTDGNTLKAAAVTVSDSYGDINISLPEKRTPYLRVCFADGWHPAKEDILTVLVRLSGNSLSVNISLETVDRELIIDENSLKLAYGSEYNIGTKTSGYSLHVCPSACISEISVIPDSELTDPVVFTSDGIISMSIQEELDPLCKSFPMRKLSLSLDNSRRILDTFAAVNFYRSPVKTEIAIDGEYINTGEFFIDGFETQKSGLTVKITAYDCVKSMERYKTGYYLSPGTSATLTELIAAGNFVFGGVTFNVDGYCGIMPLSPNMKNPDTQRNVLKGIAQAACGRIWADRNNVVNILSGSAGDNYHILNADRIYSYDGIKDIRPADFVEVEGESGTGKYKAQIGSYFYGCEVETITNNFIAKGNETSIAANIYNRLQERSEMTVRYRGDPCIEINDSVLLQNINGELMAFFDVIGVTLDYNGGLSGTLKLKGSGNPGGPAAVRTMALDRLREDTVRMTRSRINPLFSKDDGVGGVQLAPNPLYYLNGVPVNDEESYLKAGYKKTASGEATGNVIYGGILAVNKDGSLRKIQNTDKE